MEGLVTIVTTPCTYDAARVVHNSSICHEVLKKIFFRKRRTIKRLALYSFFRKSKVSNPGPESFETEGICICNSVVKGVMVCDQRFSFCICLCRSFCILTSQLWGPTIRSCPPPPHKLPCSVCTYFDHIILLQKGLIFKICYLNKLHFDIFPFC